MLWAACVGLLVVGGCQPGSSESGLGSDGAAVASLPYAAAVSASQGKVDSSMWPVARGTLDGVTYNFKYPADWSEGLTYCAPGAAKAGEGEAHLPTGCVSTDFLAGKKARDVGRIAGEALDVGGKTGVRMIESAPSNVLVSRVYTLMVYESDGAPLFGLVTMVGPDTSRAVQEEITASLDAVAATLRVEK